MKKIQLTKQQYEAGVRSGDLLHVYDKKNKEIVTIQRDGYYPPEQLKNFVNIETPTGKLK